MGRARHTHALDRVVQREFPVYGLNHTPTKEKVIEDVRVAVCGYDVRASWDQDRNFDDNLNNVSCPTCNKKLAKAALKARPVGAGRLVIDPDKDAQGHFRYQGGSRVILDGEIIGYVGYEDHGWRVYPLILERYDAKARAEGAYIRNSPTPLKTDGSTVSRGLYSYLGRDVFVYRSKEAAAMGCEASYLAGLLKTEAQILDEHAQARTAAQIEAEARASRKAAQQAVKDETLAALTEILDAGGLTNFQTQGLMNAIALVEKVQITGFVEDPTP